MKTKEEKLNESNLIIEKLEKMEKIFKDEIVPLNFIDKYRSQKLIDDEIDFFISALKIKLEQEVIKRYNIQRELF